MPSKDCWYLFNQTVIPSRRALLWGPPGSGKTTVANRLGKLLQLPVENITLPKDGSSAALIGHFKLSPYGDSPVPQYVWHHGTAIRAWLKGGILVLNELDQASDEVEIELHNVLDDLEIANRTLDSGETVAPLPSFRVIATMNADPSVLNEALRDRFDIEVHIDKIHPGGLNALLGLKKRAPLPRLKPTKKRVVTPALRKAVVQAVRDTIMDPKQRVSHRKAISFLRLCRWTDMETAAAAVWGVERGRAVLTPLKMLMARYSVRNEEGQG